MAKKPNYDELNKTVTVGRMLEGAQEINLKLSENEEDYHQQKQKMKMISNFVNKNSNYLYKLKLKDISQFGPDNEFDDNEYMNGNNITEEENYMLMDLSSHQTMIIQYILYLAESLKIEPIHCIEQFFTRRKIDKNYNQQFTRQLRQFREWLEQCARKNNKDLEEKEKQQKQEQHLASDGLDPIEVMESLPKGSQQFFESHDITKSPDDVSKIPNEETVHHRDHYIKSSVSTTNVTYTKGDGEKLELKK
ncbi:unnamed protein product [Rotaria sp. Silwood2]|nr:unnamed protein product [Rotaria sp. Silwood2]